MDRIRECRDTVVRIHGGPEIPLSELTFTFSRAGGPGGQHVNKVETDVTLLFDVGASASLTPVQKTLLRSRLGKKIGQDGILRLSERGSRSQWRNRERVVERFTRLLGDMMKTRKPRVKSSPTPAAREARLRGKRIRASRKIRRRRPAAEQE